MSNRAIAIYGGSFNPPHVGHVLASAWALSTHHLDQVWFVPTYRHAFGKTLLRFDRRCEMTELAIRPFGDRARVCRIEAEMGGESRTIDTMNVLVERHPDVDFSLLVGADILLEAHKWKKFDELKRRFPLHVVGRAGIEVPGHSFAIELPSISSTELRRRVASGDLDYCGPRLPALVLQLIVESRHYEEPA